MEGLSLLSYFIVGLWLVPSILTAVVLKYAQRERHRIMVFPTILLSIPFTVMVVFLLVQLLRLVDKSGLVEVASTVGFEEQLVYATILLGLSSIIATYFSAKFFARKEE